MLLAAQTTSDDTSADYEELYGEYAGKVVWTMPRVHRHKEKSDQQHRWCFCDRSKLMDKLSVEDASKLLFQVDATREGSSWTKMELKPFYTIHHTRYMVYWNQQTPEAYAASDLAKEEAEAGSSGEAHTRQSGYGRTAERGWTQSAVVGFGQGIAYGEHYRDAGANNWFEYDLPPRARPTV